MITIDNKSIYEQLNDANDRIESLEDLQCKTALQPFSAGNSGGRKILSNIQMEHAVPPIYGQTAWVQTGFENLFGDRSSTVQVADGPKRVLGIVPKFENAPDVDYYMLLLDINTETIELYHRKVAEYTSECYGILWNNARMDELSEGDIVPDGNRITESSSYDYYGNRMDSVNLNSLYEATDGNMQDSIIISSDAAVILSSPHVNYPETLLNNNYKPLNLYGTKTEIKSFPDIGETIEKGILMGYRVEKKEESLFTEKLSSLSSLMMSDKTLTIDGGGTVVDIDVLCNDPDVLQNEKCNAQIYKYYQYSINHMNHFVQVVDTILRDNPSYKVAYELQLYYEYCTGVLSGKKFQKDNTVFNGTLLRFTVVNIEPMKKGDKMADRYGGKGVVSKVVPTHLMPIDMFGNRIHQIINQGTCVGRENTGQLDEITESFFVQAMIAHIKERLEEMQENDDEIDPMVEVVEPLSHLISYFSKDCASDFYNKCEEYGNERDGSLETFLTEILNTGNLVISVLPMTDTITIDTISAIRQEFPYLRPKPIKGFQKDSNGNYREIMSRRPLETGWKAMYRLKQYSAEKFSAVSLSAVNIQGLNTKSKAAKNYLEPYSTTPITIGNMENGDMGHMGNEYVLYYMMVHAASPQARQELEEMYYGNPMNINIRLSPDAINRNAEIVSVLLMSKGIELTITKHKKEKNYAMTMNAFTKIEPPKQALRLIDDEYYDWKAYCDRMRNLVTHETPINAMYCKAFVSTEKSQYSSVADKVHFEQWVKMWGEQYGFAIDEETGRYYHTTEQKILSLPFKDEEEKEGETNGDDET